MRTDWIIHGSIALALGAVAFAIGMRWLDANYSGNIERWEKLQGRAGWAMLIAFVLITHGCNAVHDGFQGFISQPDDDAPSGKIGDM